MPPPTIPILRGFDGTRILPLTLAQVRLARDCNIMAMRTVTCHNMKPYKDVNPKYRNGGGRRIELVHVKIIAP
jgi:hypothetical protein